MDCHGVGWVRISRFPFTAFHTKRPASQGLGSGGGTYLTVY